MPPITKAELAAQVEALRKSLKRERAKSARFKAELTEALDQHAATADILRVISASPTDLQPVLDAVAKNAARFCGADDAEIFHLHAENLKVAAHHGRLFTELEGRNGDRSGAWAA
jgi:hypothetical protein